MSAPNLDPKKYILSSQKPNHNGCWIWQKSGEGGYGRGYFLGKKILSHRLSWIAFKGNIPEGLKVLHKCDTPLCVNPDHLFLGTQKDNCDDMIKKGRQKNSFGSKHWNAKLTEKDVLKIRENKGKLSYSEMAKIYGVDSTVIGAVIRRKTWRHL